MKLGYVGTCITRLYSAFFTVSSSSFRLLNSPPNQQCMAGDPFLPHLVAVCSRIGPLPHKMEITSVILPSVFIRCHHQRLIARSRAATQPLSHRDGLVVQLDGPKFQLATQNGSPGRRAEASRVLVVVQTSGSVLRNPCSQPGYRHGSAARRTCSKGIIRGASSDS